MNPEEIFGLLDDERVVVRIADDPETWTRLFADLLERAAVRAKNRCDPLLADRLNEKAERLRGD